MEIFWVLGIPLLGGLLLALFGTRKDAPELNSAMSFCTFVAAAMLTARVISSGSFTAWDELFFVDAFNVFLVALTAFVGFTTSLFSRPYMRIEQHHGKLSVNMLRLYYSMYQLFSFTMLLALLTNNMGILWVAMEAATLTTVLLVSLYRTPASIEAAWKYFILCGVGLAQALFGTILLYFAAEKILGAGGTALLWTHLNAVKTQLEPTVLSLAFVFLLVGYGTKVGLVPLHNWLPDAHAEGPTPVSAVLSGLLLNVALYAVVRSKVLVDGALGQSLRGQFYDGIRPAQRGDGGLVPVAAKRRETHVRLLLHRAYGVDDLRLRHGRAGGHLRGNVAHDRTQPDQIGHLLRRRPCRAKIRHPIDGRHTRPDQDQSHHRLGAGAGHAGDPRHAAVRRVYQRIHDPHHRHARLPVDHAFPAHRIGSCIRRDFRARANDGVRRNQQ